MRKLFALVLAGLLLAFPLSVQAEGENDPLWNRPSYEKKVYRIGQRLLQANGIEKKIAFRILGEKEVNAYAQEDIGSTIWVDRGLLNMIDSDDELAAVLGHEIAHITEGHFQGARTKRAGRMVMGGVIGAMALPTYGLSLLALPMIRGASASSSRTRETEADRRGIDYLVGANFDPYAMESVLNKISSDGKKSLQVWASHPGGTVRVDRIRAYIAQAYPGLVRTVAGDQPLVRAVPEAVESDPVAVTASSDTLSGNGQTKLHQQLALLAEYGDIPEDKDEDKREIPEPDQTHPFRQEAFALSGQAGEGDDEPVRAEKTISVAEALLSLTPDELRFIRLLKKQEFMEARQFGTHFADMNTESVEVMLWNLERKQLIRVLGSTQDGLYVLTDRAAKALGQN